MLRSNPEPPEENSVLAGLPIFRVQFFFLTGCRPAAPSGDLCMVLKLPESGSADERDPLTPHFTFEPVMREDLDSVRFKDIMRLRFEVYCLECNYLDERDYDEGFEFDRYDARSFHVGAHNLDGLLVGAVRLVCGKEGEAFPFEEHCTIFDAYPFPPREQCAEVSRLVVRKDFRRRLHRHGNNPQVMLGMYRELYRYSRKTGIRYWFAAMERALARSTNKIGFHFVPAGPETNYYGPVTPYVIDLWGLHDNLHLLDSHADDRVSLRASRWNLFAMAC